MTQLDLKFDGKTYDHSKDSVRLSGQYRKVFDFMRDGCWHTLESISIETGSPQASVSARLRDMRKPRFGGHVVDRRRVGGGLWEYRLRIIDSIL